MKDNAFNTTFESLGGHPEALKRPQCWCHILCELHFLERGPRWVPRNEEVQRQLDAYIELHKTAAKQVGPSSLQLPICSAAGVCSQYIYPTMPRKPRCRPFCQCHLWTWPWQARNLLPSAIASSEAVLLLNG